MCKPQVKAWKGKQLIIAGGRTVYLLRQIVQRYAGLGSAVIVVDTHKSILAANRRDQFEDSFSPSASDEVCIDYGSYNEDLFIERILSGIRSRPGATNLLARSQAGRRSGRAHVLVSAVSSTSTSNSSRSDDQRGRGLKSRCVRGHEPPKSVSLRGYRLCFTPKPSGHSHRPRIAKIGQMEHSASDSLQFIRMISRSALRRFLDCLSVEHSLDLSWVMVGQLSSSLETCRSSVALAVFGVSAPAISAIHLHVFRRSKPKGRFIRHQPLSAETVEVSERARMPQTVEANRNLIDTHPRPTNLRGDVCEHDGNSEVIHAAAPSDCANLVTCLTSHSHNSYSNHVIEPRSFKLANYEVLNRKFVSGHVRNPGRPLLMISSVWMVRSQGFLSTVRTLESQRPAPSSLTLRPIPNIEPADNQFSWSEANRANQTMPVADCKTHMQIALYRSPYSHQEATTEFALPHNKFDHLSPDYAPGSSRFVSYKTILPTQFNEAPSATTQLWFSLQSAPALLKFWKLRDMSLEKREAIFSKSHHDHARVSRLVPYSSLILTVSCVVIFLAQFYILEPLIKRYNKQYKLLKPAQQRSLINHYVAATIKIILLFAALYPSVLIVSGRKSLHSHFGNSKVEYGDILLCVFEVFTSMYIFELFYREKVSYISAAHHIGAIIITQTAIVLFEDPKQRQDAEIEFNLCILWGFFDIAAELWPHIAIIIYRTRPKSHAALADIFLATAILEIIGTTTETVTIFTIFFLLWKQWTIEFRVLTPLLHILFSCAQIWGARVFWLMSRQHRKVVEDCEMIDVASEALSSPPNYQMRVYANGIRCMIVDPMKGTSLMSAENDLSKRDRLDISRVLQATRKMSLPCFIHTFSNLASVCEVCTTADSRHELPPKDGCLHLLQRYREA
ncbi:hypothetical protein KCU71_g183, partial [Aureobasidium melanogenum]